MGGTKFLSITAASIIIICIVYIVVRPMTHNSNNKEKVIMFGRSTMSLWFKHWNWPYPLRIKTTYKPWPIPYKKYSNKNVFYQYYPMNDPTSQNNEMEFGENMLKSVERGLNAENYDAAFFKFCFVDFRVVEDTKDLRYEMLKNIVWNVYNKVSRKNMKLIIGNALPLPKPNSATLELQLKYNKWLNKFAKDKDDVIIFDLFTPLTNGNGELNMALSHAKGDHHPGEKAFAILDDSFFETVNKFLF